MNNPRYGKGTEIIYNFEMINDHIINSFKRCKFIETEHL